MDKYIGFKIEDNEYAVPILKVQEIIKLPQITKMPNAPSYVEGITNLRGRVVTVINLKKILNAGDISDNAKVIVITSGKMIFGVLVDDITGVVNVEDVEPVDGVINSELIAGIAKLPNRMVTLLDVKKMIPGEDQSLFEDEVMNIVDEGDKVEIIKKVSGIGGETIVKEIVDPVKFYQDKGLSKDDPRFELLTEITKFMDSVASGNYEEADKIMDNIIQKSQSDLFKEVGKVARKLHDSLKTFKEAIDPRLKEMAAERMPRAVDQLQSVIEKTEDATQRTLGIIEKYIIKMDEFADNIRVLQGPEESIEWIKNFKNMLEDDLNEILTIQSFQDLTGQIIKKVISLVDELETELITLIKTFGLKIEDKEMVKKEILTVSQEGIDELLKEFGF